MDPVPSWPMVTPTTVPTSIIPPNDLSQYGALDFALWEDIGEEFLVKTTISNWIACEAGTGSFTKWLTGSLTCRMIKSITDQCPDLPDGPWEFVGDETHDGPHIDIPSGLYYFFDGSDSTSWPTHDPCGQNAEKHNTDKYPEGQIWVQ